MHSRRPGCLDQSTCFFALHCKFGDAHWLVCIGVQMTLAAPYYPQPLDILIDISLSALVLKATTFHFIFTLH